MGTRLREHARPPGPDTLNPCGVCAPRALRGHAFQTVPGTWHWSVAVLANAPGRAQSSGTRGGCSVRVRADPPAAASRARGTAQQGAVGCRERWVCGRGMDADTGATLGRPRWPCAGRALADPGSAARGPAGADAAAPLGSALLRAAQARAPPPRRSRRARGIRATPRGGAAELGASLAPASTRPEGPGTPRERRHPGSGLLCTTSLPPGPRRVGAYVQGRDVRIRMQVKVVVS